MNIPKFQRVTEQFHVDGKIVTQKDLTDEDRKKLGELDKTAMNRLKAILYQMIGPTGEAIIRIYPNKKIEAVFPNGHVLYRSENWE